MKCGLCSKGSVEKNSRCEKCPSEEWSHPPSLNKCVPECGAGERSNGTGCEPCPQGQYQDKVKHAESSCSYCADKMTTSKMGATAKTDCIGMYT